MKQSAFQIGYFLAFFIVMGPTHSTYCQEYDLIQIDKNQGLSNSWITSLFQDSKGMIWIGTMQGLNRYDGHQVKSYMADQTKRHCLRGNYIVGVNEDRQGLLWVSSTEGLALFDPLWNRFEYIQDYTDEVKPQNVSKIIVDGKGQIWFFQHLDGKPIMYRLTTGDNLLSKLRSGTLSKNDFTIQKVQLPRDFGSKFMFLRLQDETHLLLAGDNALFFIYDTGRNQFKKVDVKNYTITLRDGTQLFRPVNGRNSPVIYPDISFKEKLSLQQMAEVLWLPDGRQLLARFYDQNLYDITKEVEEGTGIPLPKLQKKLSLKDPQSIARMVDQEGNIWLGSAGNGLYLFRAQKGFQLFAKGSSFYNIEEINTDLIWQGVFNKRQVLHIPYGSMQDAPWAIPFSGNTEVIAVKTSKKSKKSYLVCKQASSPGITLMEYHHALNKITKINLEMSFVDVPVIIEDVNQHIWIVGANGETARYNPLSERVTLSNFSHLFPAAKKSRLLPRSLALAENGSIWCALDEGIIHIQTRPDSVHFTAWHNYTEKGVIFPNPGVSCIVPDPADQQVVWLGTQGSGLCRFNTKSLALECYQNDVWKIFDVGSVQPDLSGHLWITSEKGLSCFEPQSRRFIGFRSKEVLSNYKYNPTSFLRLDNGKIYFGTWDGLLEIDPSELINQIHSSRIEISEILINGKEIDKPENVLKIHKDGQLSIRLSHLQNNILLRLSSPNSQTAGGSTFEFRIAEHSTIWVPADEHGAVHLNGLAPGSYTIEVRRAEGILKEGQEAHLTIGMRILSPWYFSIPARIFYILLLMGIVFYFFKIKKDEVEKKYAAELHTKEVQRLQFMDQFRKRFTAYLAHEFKTPLTIIIGLVELMKQNAGHNPPEEYLESIQKEGNEMLDLVGEMMDIMKLEEGKIHLHHEYHELNDFIKVSLASFGKLANLKQVNFVLALQEEPIDLYFDGARTKYILNNLLSNALRHTPKGGTIKVEIQTRDTHFVEIKIIDNGEGIPEDKLPFIFDRYFQVQSEQPNNRNFGIGLTFVKEMVETLGGDIRVESKSGKGTAFIFTLPTDNHLNEIMTEETKEEVIYPSVIDVEENVTRTNKPLLLICEDNPTILSYLEIFLQSSFDVMKARNGQEGLKMAFEYLPDLILTDINMPLMDGLMMTAKIKAQTLTDHIPVIMLTGKTEMEDKIAGKESGADAYIGKPFHYRELLLTLQNQYNIQQKWKEKYTSEYQTILEDYAGFHEEFSVIKRNRKEKLSDSSTLFLKNLLEAFENNYSDEQYDIVQMCRHLFISRTQLFRKLASITEERPMELLRNFRLHKAAILLTKEPDLSIGDVVSKVGFKERTHFNSIFQKKFNMTPSEWRKKSD